MGRWDDFPPVELIPAPKTLRQTALRIADQCAHSAYLYWRHDGTPGSAPLHRGRAFHAVAEKVARTCVQYGEPRMAPHDVKAILDEVLVENPEWVVPASEMDGLRVMVQHFAEHFRCPDDPLIEQLFHLAVSDSVVSGTVDLAWCENGTLFIRDYKTGPSFPSFDDIAGKDPVTGEHRGAKAFQLILYTLLIADGVAVAKDWEIPSGVNEFDVAFVYPFHVAGDGSGMLERGLRITRPELIEHRAFIKALVKRVEYGFRTGKWPAVPSLTACNQCPAPSECPLPAMFRKTRGEDQELQDAAEEFLFMSRDTDEKRKVLKEIAGRVGPIPIGDTLELSHKRTDSRRLTKTGKQLLEAGQPVPSAEYVTSEGTRFGINPRGTGF